MNMMKNVALMAMGGAITYAYQKYNKQVMNTMKNVAKMAPGNYIRQKAEAKSMVETVLNVMKNNK